MRALLLVLVGCWTGFVAPTDEPRVPERTGVNRRFRIAEVRAIRRCRADGPPTLIFTFRNGKRTGFEIEASHAPQQVIPRTIVDGPRASFSPCYSHGCDAAMLTIDELDIGKRARGRYRVSAKAGPAYADEFEARWVGTPWAVECPKDNI